MGLIEILQTDFEFKDERGTLIQLFNGGYSQVNVITSLSGEKRGGHYHKLNAEAFYIVSGRCQVTARTCKEVEVIEFSAGDFFRIAPYIVHDFLYLEDCVLVSMYSLGVELGNDKKDIYSFE